mmetsp:Transcript_26789/g.76860  ORF Transcript_26789/g.76860 Transcript_26789/m.76860 type:complete len:241 (-) Transcript_26789:556-1278(-)
MTSRTLLTLCCGPPTAASHAAREPVELQDAVFTSQRFRAAASTLEAREFQDAALVSRSASELPAAPDSCWSGSRGAPSSNAVFQAKARSAAAQGTPEPRELHEAVFHSQRLRATASATEPRELQEIAFMSSRLAPGFAPAGMSPDEHASCGFSVSECSTSVLAHEAEHPHLSSKRTTGRPSEEMASPCVSSLHSSIFSGCPNEAAFWEPSVSASAASSEASNAKACADRWTSSLGTVQCT